MQHSNHSRFKRAVLKNCCYVCENPHCDADADTVHHLLKVSLYPEYESEDLNGVGLCGPCHAELERRLRQAGPWQELLPADRLVWIEQNETVVD